MVAILHDINHALRSFDRLLLVKERRLIAALPSTEVAVPALEALYGVALSCVTTSQGDLVVSPMRKAQKVPCAHLRAELA